MSHLLSIPSRLDPRRRRTHAPLDWTDQGPLVPDPWSDLATELDGRVVRPGDPDWDAARAAWHLEVDQRPEAVVIAASTRDVIAAVNTARRCGFRVAAQSTGHNAGPLGDLAGTILVRMHEMREVQVDPVTRVARAEGGAQWQDVTAPAAEHGLAALAGSAADVGVAGYTLGGGVSWLARSHGLSANSVVAIEVVTADGVLRRVDEDHDPELFWALRGGGGSFGVVTALEFRLYPITEVYAGVLFFPLERAAEVLHAWREWVPGVPESVTSVGRVLRFPPLPDLPPFLSGQSYVVVEATCQLTRRGGGRAARSAAGAGSGDRHLRHHPDDRARPAAHGPAGSGARSGRRCTASPRFPRRRSTPPSAWSGRAWSARCCPSSCATSAGCSRRGGWRVVPRRASTRSS